MKALIPFLWMFVLAWIVQLFLPWWSMAIVTAGIAFGLKMNAGKAFLIGFLSIFLGWLVYSMWLSAGNEGILAGRMAQLFNLPIGAVGMMLLTSSVGGLVGAMAAATGAMARVGNR